MEGRYSETLITTYKTTRSHNPENHDQNKSLRSEYFFAFMQTIYAPSRVVSDMLMYWLQFLVYQWGKCVA
jgi:hypothetical protein